MEIKNGIEILAVKQFLSLFKTFKMLFGSITQELLSLLKFLSFLDNLL